MNPEIDKLVDGAQQIIVVNELNQVKRDSACTEQNEQLEGNSKCANCGADLVGRYCHACGQSANIHHSLLHLLEELGHGLLHFDTKAWRTIPALIMRPGQLTRDYIAGQRTRFVSPLALFLFMMFFMFFVFSFNSNNSNNTLVNDLANGGSTTYRVLEEQKEKLLTEILDQEQNKLDLKEQNLSVNETDAQIQKLKKELQNIELALSSQLASAASASAITAKKDANSDAELEEKKINLNELSKKITREDLDKNMQVNVPFFSNEKIKDRIFHALQNPELTLYKLKSGIAKYTFLLIPLTLPFLWLMFVWRRQYTMFDHAVFSLYSLCFMALLFSSLSILAALGFEILSWFLFSIVPPVHIFRQLRQAYQLGVLSALWRTLVLLLIAFVSVLFYMLIVFGISL
jgi:hypothetical protein